MSAEGLSLHPRKHTDQQVLVFCLLELLNMEGFVKCPPRTKSHQKKEQDGLQILRGDIYLQKRVEQNTGVPEAEGMTQGCLGQLVLSTVDKGNSQSSSNMDISYFTTIPQYDPFHSRKPMYM